MNAKFWVLISVFINILLLGVTCFFAYKWIDMSVTAGYLDSERYENNEAFHLAHYVMITEFLGRSKEDVVRSLQKTIDANNVINAPFFEKNEDGYDNVYFGRLVFKFKNDVLVSIERE